jgi:hypothetical protein
MEEDREDEHRLLKGVAFIVVTAGAAAAAATGGPIATYYHAQGAVAGATYGVAAYVQADPYHNEPGGEFVHIETSPVIGTVSIGFGILGTSD